MGTRYIIGDLVTGRRITNLPVTSGSWSDDLDVAESLSATVDLNDPDIHKLDLQNQARVVRTFLAAVDTGPFGQNQRILGAGPIWNIHYDKPAKSLQLNARGIQSIFDHRYILPSSARTAAVTSWVIVDPSDPSGNGTIPNPALATTFTGTIGDIMVQLISQAMAWPYDTLPLVLPALVGGTSNTKTYNAADFKTVGSAIVDLINLDVGVEIDFNPVFTSDGLGIQWNVVTGTAAQPLLFTQDGAGNAIITTWNVTVEQSPIENLTLDIDGSNLAALSWAVGGRNNDIALISRAEDDTLPIAGYPFLETLDSTHNDVVIQATLDSYATANLKLARGTQDTVAFTVKSYPLDPDQVGPDGNPLAAGPWASNYDVGDFIRLHFEPYATSTDLGDLFYLAGGDINLRIVGTSGDAKGEDVQIKCAPVVG